MVASVETDDGAREGVVHQTGDGHCGVAGPSRRHVEPPGISEPVDITIVTRQGQNNIKITSSISPGNGYIVENF